MMLLSIDFGTSSVKSALLDERCEIIDTAKETYHYRVLENQGVELNAGVLFDAMVRSLRKFDDYLGRIEGIAYDTFSPSFLLMDDRGDAICPILTHLDRRSRAQSRRIVDVFGLEEFRNITGVLPFSGGVSVTSFLWLLENTPDAVTGCRMAGHLNSCIYKKLTGVWATDPVNASMTGLYETVTQAGWSDTLCDALHLPKEKLPPIRHAGSVLGRLTREAAALTGLREGIPVGLGTNDVAASQIGAGNTAQGESLNISGSSEMISIISDKPVIDPRYYLRNAATPGKWQLYATTVGGFALEWFRRQFCREMDIDAFYDGYLPEVIGADTDNGVRFIQHLAEDRQSLEEKHGAFLGLSLSTTRDDMLRSVLTGINAPVVETLSIARGFLELSGTIKITGGLVSPHYIDFKKRLISGFAFEHIDQCAVIGNVKLLLAHMDDAG